MVTYLHYYYYYYYYHYYYYYYHHHHHKLLPSSSSLTSPLSPCFLPPTIITQDIIPPASHYCSGLIVE